MRRVDRKMATTDSFLTVFLCSYVTVVYCTIRSGRAMSRYRYNDGLILLNMGSPFPTVSGH